MSSPRKAKVRAFTAVMLVIGAVFVISAVAMLALWKVVAENKPYVMPSEAMTPTLKLKSVHLVNLNAYRESPPKVGDIVVYHAPSLAQRRPDEPVIFISRCVGTEGDVIEIRKGDLYRNGVVVKEPYVRTKPNPDFKLVHLKGMAFPLQNSFGTQFYATPEQFQLEDPLEFEAALKLPAIPVPAGSVIVMGDNRPGAFDSRCWGLLPISRVIGQVTDAK